MCGLFGMIRTPGATQLASDALVALGTLAVERGRDSAGLAYVSPSWATKIVKRKGLFHQSMRKADFMPIAESRVVLGHTRWATQGSTADRANISPMKLSRIVGTHNGDVDIESIPGIHALPAPKGGTDTERLYQAIESEASLEGIAKLLSQVKGRAALAWMDTDQPNTIFLARAALSPLATAYDKEGNLYWVSNPNWFRLVDKSLDGAVGFHSITMFNEGTVAVVDTTTMQVQHNEQFIPVCRSKDSRMVDVSVHRGFTEQDRKADKEGFCHTVAPGVTIRSSGTRGLWDSWQPSPSGGSYSQEALWGDTVETERERDAAWNWWNNGSTFELDEIDRDEATDFVLEWVDLGQSDLVLAEFKSATTEPKRQSLAHKYELGHPGQVVLIRDMMLEWDDFDAEMGQGHE